MGQGLSCYGSISKQDFFRAVELGDLEAAQLSLSRDPAILHRNTLFDRSSAVHMAAANGNLQLLSMIIDLDRPVNPDPLNRNKQTPLMLAAMHGKIACVQKLLEAGANILKFDGVNGRTCLHYAAYYGHSDCLQAILSAAQSTRLANSWGFARFVNVSDGSGATPLHLAAGQGQAACVHILLDNGAFVCSLTGRYGCPGSSPLHLAARGGCLDCVRELLAWGGDRLQKDSAGRIPYIIALKRKHGVCAALLNPSSAEPLVWPSPLKLISELNHDAKALLESALMEANRTREKNILKGTEYSLDSPVHSEGEGSEPELCCICFDQACTIEVQDCGHQMCEHCTLALCCHNKPNPASSCQSVPLCPFCRSNIARLVVAKSVFTSTNSRRPRNFSNEGCSNFKGLSSSLGSFGRMGTCRSGKIITSNDMVGKARAN
ncbi:E3 ubiquitin-protein ligase XB3 [Apostasia shenzhenica]|uniref:RING-type E3 ubiquitin transferase n=1 Tax=Apostasia shenzhenica TaxID=1088818 RepID=A0A2H9ZZ50_9ASPA|nr:E3 ubiquitin-protein ligase XB3 [Apostasia shenzhenica]